MQKITSLTILTLLLLSVILSACSPASGNVSEVFGSSYSGDTIVSDENSVVQSEVNTSFSQESEDTLESSVYEDSDDAEESTDDGISAVEEYNEFHKQNIVEVYGKYKYKDYCTCGAHEMCDEIYEIGVEYGDIEMERLLAENGYAESEEYVTSQYESDVLRYVVAELGGCRRPPRMYYYVNKYSVEKEVLLKWREQTLEQYKEWGRTDDCSVPTDRQIEIMYGGYSEETVAKELLADDTFYSNGVIYKASHVNQSVAMHDGIELSPCLVKDERLKELLTDDEFRLHLYYMLALASENQAEYLIDRIKPWFPELGLDEELYSRIHTKGYYVPKNEEATAIEEYYRFHRKNSEEAFGPKTRDYCVCGAEEYSEGYYQYAVQSSKFVNELPRLLVENGYAESYAEIGRAYDKWAKTETEEPGTSQMPLLYYYITHFGVEKKVLKDWREEVIELYGESDWFRLYDVPTNGQIEVLYYGYSDELIMRALSTSLTYYFDGTVFTPTDLAYEVEDETFEKMLNEDDFRLHMYDLEKIMSVHEHELNEQLMARVAELAQE